MGLVKLTLISRLMGKWEGFLPITRLMEDSMDVFQKEVERLMDECGSSEKAQGIGRQ